MRVDPIVSSLAYVKHDAAEIVAFVIIVLRIRERINVVLLLVDTENLAIVASIIGFGLSLPLKVFIHITLAETPIAPNAVSS